MTDPQGLQDLEDLLQKAGFRFIIPPNNGDGDT